ncbi:MAG: ComF family protein [Tepidisphaeraceae bacterium]
MLKFASQFFEQTLQLAFPPRCVACGTFTEAGRFCEACDDALKALERRSQCVQCGAPVALDGAPCQRCRGRGYRLFDQVVNMGVFADPIKPLIHRLKYYHGWSVGEVLAERCGALPRVRALLAETEVLVPVPLHGWRQIARGFNQAAVIASRLAAMHRLRVRHPAIRLRATKAQSLQTSHDARVRNLRDAFALVRGRSIFDQRVVIVDDVMTTGATVKSLARALTTAKPASISVLTLAIADPKGHSFEAV